MNGATFVCVASRCRCCGAWERSIGWMPSADAVDFTTLALAKVASDLKLSPPFMAWPAFAEQPIEVYA